MTSVGLTPLTATTSSPTRSPATSAGLPGTTSRMVGCDMGPAGRGKPEDSTVTGLSVISPIPLRRRGERQLTRADRRRRTGRSPRSRPDGARRPAPAPIRPRYRARPARPARSGRTHRPPQGRTPEPAAPAPNSAGSAPDRTASSMSRATSSAMAGAMAQVQPVAESPPGAHVGGERDRGQQLDEAQRCGRRTTNGQDAT